MQNDILILGYAQFLNMQNHQTHGPCRECAIIDKSDIIFARFRKTLLARCAARCPQNIVGSDMQKGKSLRCGFCRVRGSCERMGRRLFDGQAFDVEYQGAVLGDPRHALVGVAQLSWYGESSLATS